MILTLNLKSCQIWNLFSLESVYPGYSQAVARTSQGQEATIQRRLKNSSRDFESFAWTEVGVGLVLSFILSSDKNYRRNTKLPFPS